MIRDIMDVINSQSDGAKEAYSLATRKEILNYLLRTMLQDSGLNEILQQDVIDNPIEDEKDIPEENENNNENTKVDSNRFDPYVNSEFEEPIEPNEEETSNESEGE